MVLIAVAAAVAATAQTFQIAEDWWPQYVMMALIQLQKPPQFWYQNRKPKLLFRLYWNNNHFFFFFVFMLVFSMCILNVPFIFIICLYFVKYVRQPNFRAGFLILNCWTKANEHEPQTNLHFWTNWYTFNVIGSIGTNCKVLNTQYYRQNQCKCATPFALMFKTKKKKKNHMANIVQTKQQSIKWNLF